ncbi:diacylglycerol O-acyltransferase 1-like [Saccoglossus kowalevskii]|uniref:O-acyltransferase n=1 Tax=Saccoglossus kowalevskii TaxID=10224 RepID=A0ABM0GS51_SACKO|nr:PREDICTED: diacylglycerol O-acyltransferase 1-like [Saccoglossus kowalevskii]
MSDGETEVLRRRGRQGLRRIMSTNVVDEMVRDEEKERALQPDKPCHKHMDSLLSSNSGWTNFRGVMNLCVILLGLANIRLVLENLLKYGILIDPFQVISLSLDLHGAPYSFPNVAVILALNVFIFATFSFETLLSKKSISESVGKVLNGINIALILLFAPAIILTYRPNPVGAFFALSIYTVTFLKLISYVLVNRWCRQMLEKEKHSRKRHRRSRIKSESHYTIPNGKLSTHLVQYPDNLNLKDLYYFLLAPTLCYELNFPRSERIRKRFLIRRIVEMVFLIQIVLGLIQQWIVPTVQNSMKPFSEMDLSRILERTMKLAIPNHFIWLIWFYWFFHSCLNVLAEVLRFGDREFYRDWWNSETLGYFWQNWNIPVHKWGSRHLYKPMLTRGYTRMQGQVAVFMLSAFFHEYLVSIPLQMFRLWAFMGMMTQVPLALVVNRVHKISPVYSNMMVWMSVIAGQPVAIMMYVHDYVVQNALQQSNSTVV